jgi:hypothetical protein
VVVLKLVGEAATGNLPWSPAQLKMYPCPTSNCVERHDANAVLANQWNPEHVKKTWVEVWTELPILLTEVCLKPWSQCENETSIVESLVKLMATLCTSVTHAMKHELAKELVIGLPHQ